jgi:hypothetical protein
LKFVNPFYQEQSTRVQVRSGETQIVRVVLTPKQMAARGASVPSP